MSSEARFMERAIELAKGSPPTHPNPRVGAVIVDTAGSIVGEGRHDGPGTDHAEVMALDQAGEAARGSTLFVTLEPCSHHGRTPPCVEAVVAAGVRAVVVATLDPDHRVSGEGARRLAESGLEVSVGNHEDEALALDRAYFHHRRTGMPLVTVKWAMTLDGAVAAADGTSQWITSEETRAEAHGLRAEVDAVVVGAGTLRSDDPRLDVRRDGYDGPQPRPVVVAGNSQIPSDSKLWSRDPVVVSTEKRPIPSGELLIVGGDDGWPDPAGTCRALADVGLLHMLLEGGPTLAGSWWRAGVVAEGFAHIGGKVGGGAGQSPMAGVFATIAQAEQVEFVSVRNVGDDVVVGFRKKS